VFRSKIDTCLSTIAEQIAACLADAKTRGDLPKRADPQKMAMLLVNCWEGAALRSRLQRSPKPLDEMLDFYFQVAGRS
jgi:TetR/AcrR family transcriptional repressor of nem operon